MVQESYSGTTHVFSDGWLLKRGTGGYGDVELGVESRNTAARLDFDTPSRIGRITCWDSGAVYAEVLDAESGRDLLDQHGSFNSAAGLTILLKSLLEKLATARG